MAYLHAHPDSQIGRIATYRETRVGYQELSDQIAGLEAAYMENFDTKTTRSTEEILLDIDAAVIAGDETAGLDAEHVAAGELEASTTTGPRPSINWTLTSPRRQHPMSPLQARRWIISSRFCGSTKGRCSRIIRWRRAALACPHPENQINAPRPIESGGVLMSKPKKIVLAYSGGLDTSIILKWLQSEYGCEIVTFTADLGQGEELEPARAKAELLGIKPENIFIEDLREEFVRDFVFPMFRANAVYEGLYLLGTALRDR